MRTLYSEGHKMTELQKLNDKLKTIEQKIIELDQQSRQLQSQLALKKNEREELKIQIEDVENGNFELEISDHAIVRYLERVEDFDIEAVKKEIQTHKIKREYLYKGDGKYFNERLNCFVCIKNKTITTLHYGDYDIKEIVKL